METKAKKKRKPSTFRHWFQAAFFALTNGYAQGFVQGKIYNGENKALCVPGLNCYSCPGAYYACPIGSLQAVLNSRNFTVSCYVFGFIMVVGAFFGRLVCGFLCPFGLVQDLLYKIPFFKKLKNLPGHKYLKYLRYVMLAVFVLLLSGLIVNDAGSGKPWYCEYICPSGTLFAGIPLVATNPVLQASIGWRFTLKVVILVVIVLLSVLSFRPFCKYLCPLGALYGVCNPISFYRYRVDTDKCVSCGACQKACNMDIKVWEHPNSTECIRCGECKAACPTHAITSTWEDWKSRLVKDLPEEAPAEQTNAAEKRKAKSGLIAPEEKGNALRVILSVLVMLVGLVLAALTFQFIFSIPCMVVLCAEITSYNAFGLLCMFGTTFLCMMAGVIMVRGSFRIIRNKGRRTASIRALRVLVVPMALMIVTRVLCVFYQNTLTLAASEILWWSLPIVLGIILLTCILEKRADGKKED